MQGAKRRGANLTYLRLLDQVLRLFTLRLFLLTGSGFSLPKVCLPCFLPLGLLLFSLFALIFGLLSRHQ